MQKVNITIAKREYEVVELSALANAEWRKSLVEQYGSLIQQLMGAINVDYDTPEGISKLGNLVGQLVFQLGGSIEDLRDRVFDYAPAMAQDRDYLLENGYDSEFLQAFVRVIQLAYPFGGLGQMIGSTLQKIGDKAK